MDYLDKIREKRAKADLEKRRQYEQQKTLSTIKSGDSSVVDAITKQNAKSRTNTQPVRIDDPTAPKREDIGQVASNIDDLLVSHTIESGEVADKLDDVVAGLLTVVDCIEELPKEYDTTDLSTKLEGLIAAVKSIPKPESNKAVIAAINSLQLKPVFDPNITVSPTPITVEAPDFSKLEALLTPPVEVEEIEYEDFIAQDINDDSESFQYAGLLHPKGYWCIIENDYEANSLRYKFGKKDYAKAWANPMSLEFTYLDKALNEIKA